MKKERILVSLLLALMAALFFSAASADNRTTVSEFDYRFSTPETPCLDEGVNFHIYVTARGHEFTTPSGNYHMIDNWEFLLEGVGESTNREWVGKGVSKGGYAVHKTGEKFFYSEAAIFMPISVPGIEDGPKFRFNHLYQARWDADGNLVMEIVKGWEPDSGIHCLGKN